MGCSILGFPAKTHTYVGPLNDSRQGAYAGAMMLILRLCAVLGLLFVAGPAWAWGERGHDLVTRSGVEMLREHAGDDSPLFRAFSRRADMLSHFSNLPDIQWRNAGKAVEKANGPTHYVHVDVMVEGESFSGAPKTLAEAYTRVERKRKKMPDEGTAPWRVGQLSAHLEEAFKQVAATSPSDKKAFATAMVRVFSYAGLLSHFIGDLANPHHCHSNHDGWDSRQGGIHSYFEGDLVRSLGMSLGKQVIETARALHRGKDTNFERMRRVLLVEDSWQGERGYTYLAWLLALNSVSKLETLNTMDMTLAVTTKSAPGKGARRAKRKSPDDVAPRFEPIIAARMAMAADVLSGIWFTAWKRAGKPDLSSYRGYDYPLSLEFVPAPKP